MMLLQLAKRRILPFSTAAHAAHHNRRCYSSPTTPNPNPNFSVVDYLIATFGFSPDKAAKVSKRISHIISPEKPGAVLRFLSHNGFSQADIKSIVTWWPTILCTSPETTLEPKLCALRDMGLSGPTIIQIAVSNPFHPNTTVQGIKFWRDFIGGNGATLIIVFKQNGGLIGHDITPIIAPRIFLLQSYGLSAKGIQMVACTPRMITGVSVLEDMLNSAKDSGFQPSSGMFVIGLEVMGCASREALQKKMNLLKSFGWSEKEVFSALRNAPSIAALKEETLRVKMNFLLGEAGCDISYIASNPLLLKFSLAKRMWPRLRVLRLLSKGLSVPGQGFYSAMRISNDKFFGRYILPHKNEIPELCDICLSERA